MKVLFWNTHKNPNINQVLCEVIAENNISLVVLAEYEGEFYELSKELAEIGINMQEYLTAGCDRIKIIGIEQNISPGLQTKYASFQIINNKDILCCIHLSSQIYTKGHKMRMAEINSIVAEIADMEEKFGTENTIILGDFNANPYDNECLAFNQFHGIPYYKEAAKKTRTIGNEIFKMFYNPMWNFFGDCEKPFGTYYHSDSDTFWNIYDQVIIRPSLKDRFSNLQILTETQNRYLLNDRGYPDENISDHLPITFEILED